MNAYALVRAFEAASVDPSAFHHREHLLVAFTYLRSMTLEQALARYVEHLRRLTVALGVPEKFHATMTWTYVVALADAMAEHPGLGFDALLEACPQLLDHRAGVLAMHYDREELDSPRARARFVLPRRR
jgi:hypothetical protein